MYSKSITTKLRNIILFTRDIDKTSSFFTDALGLKVIHQSQIFAELTDASKQKIYLKKSFSEAYCSTGYSPMLNFEIENLDNMIEKAKVYGAILDGEKIQDENHKIACIRVPEGPMIGLVEYTSKAETESEEEDETPTQEADKNIKEMKNILRKIKF